MIKSFENVTHTVLMDASNQYEVNEKVISEVERIVIEKSKLLIK